MSGSESWPFPFLSLASAMTSASTNLLVQVEPAYSKVEIGGYQLNPQRGTIKKKRRVGHVHQSSTIDGMFISD